MKLKEYIENLNNLVEDNPELLEAIVLYSEDEEGNSFEEVYWHPTVGVWEDGEFRDADEEPDSLANAVCIN